VLSQAFIAWTRNRLIDLASRVEDRQYRPAGRINPGTRSMWGAVVNGGSIPTAPGRVFLVNPITVNGVPAEGGGASVAVNSATKVPVLVLGNHSPSAGDRLFAVYTHGSWVAQQNGRGSKECDPATTTVGITVRSSCPGAAAVPGATVAVTRDGVAYTGGTSDGAGSFVFGADRQGTYTAVASKPGWVTASTAVGVGVCGGLTTGTITMSPAAGPVFIRGVTGCAGIGFAGILVTALNASSTSRGTTDAAGNVDLPLPLTGGIPTTFTVHDPAGRFIDHVYTIGLNPCSTTLFHDSHQAMSVPASCPANGGTNADLAPSFVCLPAIDHPCVYPTIKFLNLHDSVYGDATLTFSCDDAGNTVWQGRKTIQVPGCVQTGCFPAIAQMCPVTSLEVTYRFGADPLGNTRMDALYVAGRLGCPGLGISIICPNLTDAVFGARIVSTMLASLVSFSCPPGFLAMFEHAPSPGNCADPWRAGSTFAVTE
jgi:hypothetical protein